MKELLLHNNYRVIKENPQKGPNVLNSLLSEIGNVDRTSQKLKIVLKENKYP